MRYANLDRFLQGPGAALPPGPIAMVFIEDPVEVASTLEHNLKIGFRSILALAPAELPISAELEALVHRIDYNTAADSMLETAVNRLIEAAPGRWMYYCYNAEYLFHPFSESRSIGELLAFQTEERRDSVLSYVIDLYAADLKKFPNAVSLETAHLDGSGYYALGRPDPLRSGEKMERQLNFFGGLRWRFEEHIPEPKRRIDRISLFRAKSGLRLGAEHTFNDEEYNTYSCPWHHNITSAVASFRTAKALKTNAGSRFEINSFLWHNSVSFRWDSGQLLGLGLMEPGQWF